MMRNYDSQMVESSAQQYWDKKQCFVAVEDHAREKFYCLSMLPYPSGQIHMGHVRNYTVGDVIARYQRMKGKNVMQPFGWDAFGLPAENAALQHQLAPSSWTYRNIEQMRADIKRLGFAIDWSREIATCTPEYYRWEQLLFLRMYEKGLVYKKRSVVNWDPVDQTVLANEQVIDGRGWRSGAVVERREIAQWFLKITAYAEELLDGLDRLIGWPEEVRMMQRNWIGRSVGVELFFNLTNSEQKIAVFTTRLDTLMGVTYIAIAPEHPLVLQMARTNDELAKFIKKHQSIKVAEAEFATLPKEGMYVGFDVIHPVTGDVLPVWVANFVLMEYGSGAVMAVPAHDQRDFEFAKQYSLPLKKVIKFITEGMVEGKWDYTQGALTAKGCLVNSGIFSGLTSDNACDAIADYLTKHGKGQRKIHYRLRDWGISRQRYWGAPIPMIDCPCCGTVPVAFANLPVILPEDITLDSPQSPLTKMDDFLNVVCPKCAGAARRETDTFDTFMESSWYYARYCCVDQSQAMFDARVNYWMPVDQYVGGIEHAIMHLLYARFIYKVMRDEGLVKGDEPFVNLLTQGMVLNNGAKMSKSKGNIVSPQTIVDKYGADTARLFIIFASPPVQSLEWSDSGVEGAYRFLKRLWNFAAEQQKICHGFNLNFDVNFLDESRELLPDFSLMVNDVEKKKIRGQIHNILKQATDDIERMQFNTVVSAAMKLLNLLDGIVGVDHVGADGGILIYEGLNILLRVLAPIVPHITHQLWRELKFPGDIIDTCWPKVDGAALAQDSVDMMVQVNGKCRAKITVAKEIAQDQSEIKKLALTCDNVQRFVDVNKIKKIIIIPNKVVNIVG